MWRACLLALVALTGCGGGGYVTVHADSMWASETREDWALHGHELALMRVETGTGPETPRDYKNSGGIIGRRVTVRLGEPLWRRPGAAAPPRRFGFATWGWMMDSDQFSFSPRRRMVAEGDAWLEVGREYLALISRQRGEWFPLVAMTLGPDGRISSRVPRGQPPAAAVALRGRTPAQAAKVLATTTFPVEDALRAGATVVVRAGDRRQARRVAAGVRALGVRFGEVRASPSARAFARIAFGRPTVDAALAAPEAGEASAVRAGDALGALLSPPRDRTSRVLVTHARTIEAAVGDSAAAGEALVYADDGFVARVLPEDWVSLGTGTRPR